MVQDPKLRELRRLRAELATASTDSARSEIRRKIAFTEAIIRMRDGTEQAEYP